MCDTVAQITENGRSRTYMCGRAILTATPSAAALGHAEMQAFRRDARFARYSRGNRQRLRLPFAS